MLAQHTGNGVVAAGQSELVFEPLSAEAGLLAQLDDLAFQAGGDLVRAVMGPSSVFGQGGRLAWLIAAEPFASGVTRAAKLTCGGFEAVGTSKRDQFLM
jgi:hypothetical protein